MAAWGGSGNSGCRSGRLGWLCRQLGRLPPRPPQASPGLPRNMKQLLGVGGVSAPRVLGLVLDSWLLLGCSWLLMADPRVLGLALDSWLLLAARGCSWQLLSARSCSGGALGLTCGRLSSLLFYPISSLFQSSKRRERERERETDRTLYQTPQTYQPQMAPIPTENSKKLEKIAKVDSPETHLRLT